MTKQTPLAGKTKQGARAGTKPATLPHGVTATNSTEPGLASLNRAAEPAGPSAGKPGQKGAKP